MPPTMFSLPEITDLPEVHALESAETEWDANTTATNATLFIGGVCHGVWSGA